MATKPQSMHAEASLHRKLVLFAVQLEGYLVHFPNCHKYTLTQAIRQAFVDVYNLVTECQKRYHKKSSLTQLDVRHEQLRMLINLAQELGLFDYSAGRKDVETPGAHRHLVLGRTSSNRFALTPSMAVSIPSSPDWAMPVAPARSNPCSTF